MIKQITTVTFNPAFDLTGQVKELRVAEVNRSTASTSLPAGKGINVAKVLADLGAMVTVTGFLGHDNRAEFEQYFADNGLNNEFVLVNGSTRTNIKLVDHSSAVTDINFEGFSVTEDDVNALEQRLLALAPHTDCFVFAGSLPSGLSTNTVAHWMSKLKAVGCNVILDSSGTMLAEGVLQQPYMIKPNEHELSELLHSPDLLKNQDLMLNHCVDAATQLHLQGIDHVLVSLGEHGLIWISDKVALHSMPPKVSIRSTVGAGDSVVAGFVWSQLNNFSPTQAIAFCTAMGTYAVSQVGVGVKAIEEVQSILDEVSVRTI